MKTPLQTLVLALSLAIGVIDVHGQGHAFTYQGRLTAHGSPASGSYDLTFGVFDAPSDGAQVGDTLTRSVVGVDSGLFTVTLDFGEGVFTGPARWLAIGVRTNGEVGGAFTALAPRQPLTATPYAITAANVSGPIHGSSIVGGSISGA